MLLTNTNAIRDYQKAAPPAEGVLQQTTPMAYATSTNTSRRKSMSPKQFRLSPTRRQNRRWQTRCKTSARKSRDLRAGIGGHITSLREKQRGHSTFSLVGGEKERTKGTGKDKGDMLVFQKSRSPPFPPYECMQTFARETTIHNEKVECPLCFLQIIGAKRHANGNR